MREVWISHLKLQESSYNIVLGLKYFDKSLNKEPNSIRTLRLRANARAKAIKFHGALEDIENILTLEPENIYLKSEKALITYLGCEFEDALIQNYRNVPLRKKPDNFVMGVMHVSKSEDKFSKIHYEVYNYSPLSFN